LPIAIEARGRKLRRLIVPAVNAREAAMVSGIEVYPVKSLLDVIHFVNTGNGIAPVTVDGDTLLGEAQHYAVDFKDVRGQQTAKRALEIACAGGHNILMIGPPRLRQDHASEAHADHPAALHVRRSARDYQDSQRSACARLRCRTGGLAPLPLAAPHYL
jgi:hypothetical protein